MSLLNRKLAAMVLCSMAAAQAAEGDVIEVSSLAELARVGAASDQAIRMKPGVYRMADYLTDEVVAEVRKQVPEGPGRPPVWMLRLSGSGNRFDFRDVVLEIDTDLYRKLPRGYTRCLFVSGDRNTIDGLTIRNTGPQQGSGGNIMSVWGQGNSIENVTLNIFGSKPYGYGDLLGKGGPNLVGLQKQSGLMVAGKDHVVRRCRVISRAFGHCFYVQNVEGKVTENIRVEDCYAEGTMRSTAEMLRETSGPLADLQYRTIAENRDRRFMVVAGYMKSLSEDGFRTYGGVGRVTLTNCTAVNTRAGFEIAGAEESENRTIIEGATALGCERAYLIGSNVVVRSSRGDTRYGPLLYLRGGKNSDVEVQWVGEGSDYTVHALATIAGEGHRVRLYTEERDRTAPAVPIMLGFGMPAHAEMASPINPAPANSITLINELPRVAVVRSEEAVDCQVETKGADFVDRDVRQLPKKP